MEAIEKIRTLLKKHNISGAKMSRELGFSNAVFSQWKNKKQKPSLDSIKKIAEYFGVPMEYFFSDIPKNNPDFSEAVNLLEAITPGEWSFVPFGGKCSREETCPKGFETVNCGCEGCECLFVTQAVVEGPSWKYGAFVPGTCDNIHDAQFIARAPALLRAALLEIQRLTSACIYFQNGGDLK